LCGCQIRWVWYCHSLRVTIDVIWIGKIVSTSKDYAVTVLHTSQITIGHSRPSQSVRVITNHCLVAASNSRCYTSSGFPIWPRP
jgi:hypothetical protein